MNEQERQQKLQQVKEDVDAKLQALATEIRSCLNANHANVAMALAKLEEARANVQLTSADDGAGNGALPD